MIAYIDGSEHAQRDAIEIACHCKVDIYCWFDTSFVDDCVPSEDGHHEYHQTHDISVLWKDGNQTGRVSSIIKY